MHRFKVGLVAIMGLALAACDREGTRTDSQVVAQVNGSEISVHQVQAALQRQPSLSAELGEAAGKKVLEGLVEQELAAQADREQKLDASPRVLQAMELAKREVLAREYQDRLADKAVPPDTSDIDRYYDEHPELFKERRQYTVQETSLKMPPGDAAAFGEKVKATTEVAAVNELVRASGLSASSRETVQWAENIPLALLKQFASLAPGHSVAIARPDGLVIGTVIRSELAPVNRRDAGPAIQAVLTNQRRREAVAQGMQDLHKAAKIKWTGGFATAASAPLAASATQ